jgi:hypothetical protein
MSTVRANQILDAAGGNTAQINGMTPTAQSLQGFRNRIINGGMVIDQRNAGASVTPTAVGPSVFTLDRWAANIDQASKFSVQRNAGSVTPPAGFTNYLGVTSLSAYSVGSAEGFTLQQQIEGFNTADLGWGAAGAQAVTVSFWVRSSLTGTFGGSLSNSAVNRSCPFAYTISAANTWEYKTVTLPGDTAGTWLTDNGVGVRVYFGLGVGASQSGTAGAWSAGYLRSATGAVSVVGTNGATFYITGVQLEAGSVATPFERRDYGRELMMCQRYYYRNAPGIINAYFGGVGAFGNTTSAAIQFQHPVQMRATPTFTQSGILLANGFNSALVTSISGAWPSSFGAQMSLTTSSAIFVGGQGAYAFDGNGNGSVVFSAEL